MRRRRDDLLCRLAVEHRDLTLVSRGLRERRSTLTPDVVRTAAARIVEHELAHRFLVHPLLQRDRRGLLLFSERREEELLLADRLRRLLRTLAEGAADPALADAVVDLDDQLAEHTDREEILAFPHLRHVIDAAELVELGALRGALAERIAPRLRTRDDLIVDGRWADASRLQLTELLELPQELVARLPAPAGVRTAQDARPSA